MEFSPERLLIHAIHHKISGGVLGILYHMAEQTFATCYSWRSGILETLRAYFKLFNMFLQINQVATYSEM